MSAISPIGVCIVTGSRADYGLMRWVIRDLTEDPSFRVGLVVTGSHLSARHGHTVDEIVADGNDIALRIPVDLARDEPMTLARAMAGIIPALAQHLEKRHPELVLILGDRWELLAVANACILTGTPIGHFSGGELTEGALDDSVRHAVTKLSHLHFVANDVYAQRVRQLGEEDWRICVCGGPGIENFQRLELLGRPALSTYLGLDLDKPTAVVTYHPPTRSSEAAEPQLESLLAALRAGCERFGLQYVVTGPNADPGSRSIEEALRGFVETSSGHVYVSNLGARIYLSLLKQARLMIGNSSSAFNEAPMAGLVCVDIGDRQSGRISGGNVISVGATRDEILSGIERGLLFDRQIKFKSPYGQGGASALARAFLKKVFVQQGADRILRKRFVDHRPCTPA